MSNMRINVRAFEPLRLLPSPRQSYHRLLFFHAAMSFKHILTVFLVLLGTVTAALGQRWYHAAAEKFGAHKTSKTAFTPLLKEFIQDVRHDWNIPGLSIAVVHAGSNGELEGFGDSTEEGAEVNAHVSLPSNYTRLKGFISVIYRPYSTLRLAPKHFWLDLWAFSWTILHTIAT